MKPWLNNQSNSNYRIMSEKKRKTIDYIKEKRVVSEEVKEKRKEFVRLKKLILKVLESGDKTIPEIANETKLPLPVVTYTLMTLRKFGDVETGEIDDDDEFFYYKLKTKK